MKIDDASKKIAGLEVGTTSTRAGKSAEKTDAAGKAASDNVTLSTQAKALSGQSASSGVFDAKKVDEIKAAIASGQFKVNAESVADGLMDTVKNLISSRR